MKSVLKQTGKKDSRLEEKELPQLCRNVWQLFWKLSDTRGAIGTSHAPITYVEIKAYLDLVDEKIEAWELDALRDIDNTFVIKMQELTNKD